MQQKGVKRYMKIMLMVFFIKNFVSGNWVVLSPKMMRLCNFGFSQSIFDKVS